MDKYSVLSGGVLQKELPTNEEAVEYAERLCEMQLSEHPEEAPDVEILNKSNVVWQSCLNYDLANYPDEALEAQDGFGTYTLKEATRDCKYYAKYEECEEAKSEYQHELKIAKGSLEELVKTGVFHDACGKPLRFSADGRKVYTLLDY